MGEEHLYDRERLKCQNGRKEDIGKVGCYNNKREICRYLQKGQTGRDKERGKLDRWTQTKENDNIIIQNLMISSINACTS